RLLDEVDRFLRRSGAVAISQVEIRPGLTGIGVRRRAHRRHAVAAQLDSVAVSLACFLNDARQLLVVRFMEMLQPPLHLLHGQFSLLEWFAIARKTLQEAEPPLGEVTHLDWAWPF